MYIFGLDFFQFVFCVIFALYSFFSLYCSRTAHLVNTVSKKKVLCGQSLKDCQLINFFFESVKTSGCRRTSNALHFFRIVKIVVAEGLPTPCTSSPGKEWQQKDCQRLALILKGKKKAISGGLPTPCSSVKGWAERLPTPCCSWRVSRKTVNGVYC